MVEMGPSEDAGVGVDCSVGTIVWVRRRNGSWWPGRILGPEELSASHLMSPRSGTPVKLLGREDASVDWYNLEKSKRVKVFRCGDFDACIERAEASQGIPIKKREKYARREDAILHALELEKLQLVGKQHKLGHSLNNVSHEFSSTLKELNSYSPGLYIGNDESVGLGKYANPKSQTLSRRVDLLPMEVSEGNLSHANPNGKQLNWEDDNSEAIPRMRGLQDFGLQIASSKRKVSTSVACETFQKSALIDNHVHILPGSGDGMGSVSNVCNGQSFLTFKRKISQGGLSEESLIKRRDRRRPLVQVLQSSAKLPAFQSLHSNCDTVSVLVQEEKEYMGSIFHAKRNRYSYLPADASESLDPAGYSSDQMPISPTQFGYSNGLDQPGSLAEEGTSSGLIEEDETDSSDMDSLDPENDMEEETTMQETTILPDVKSLVPGSRNSGRFGGDINNYETSVSNYKFHLQSYEQSADASADVRVSQWHMKGKRNIRNLTKRPMEVLNGKDSSKRSTFKMGGGGTSRKGYYHKGEELNYIYNEDESLEKDLDNESVGFGNHLCPSMLKAPSGDHSDSGINDSDEDFRNMLSSGWEADGPPQTVCRAYLGKPDECFDAPYIHPFNVGMEPMLVDVNLKVQASYQGEHVPLVSLMSRLNGKAIVGHPVQIEILEDGFSDLQLPKNGLGKDTSGFGENVAPPPVWRTGRRTAMLRVHRPPAPSALKGEQADPHPYSDLKGKHLLQMPYIAPNNQGRSIKKGSNHRQPLSGKSLKKLSKKVSLSSQKTRTLSSIATEHKRRGVNGNGKLARRNGGILDGLIKPDGTMPLVACVPVKVVFSRILEAVRRPPYMAATHLGLSTGLAEGDPL